MKITFLGHAGFCVETTSSIIIMDPWLSPDGAFDAAWFQFPQNHHMAAYVQEKLSDSSKERYIYISHEHKDHFDTKFLQSLACREFQFIIPKYRRNELRSILKNYSCKGVITCKHGEKINIADGYIRLFLDDSELNRDSAILVRADGVSFLNMNDCKIHDELPTILKDEGSITVFSSQFSGATWHPTCYDYPKEKYEEIASKKVHSKYESVARAIKTLNPKFFLPAAGPACFLDPELFHINFEETNIFPRDYHFIEWLTKRLNDSPNLVFNDLMPGDVLDTCREQFSLTNQRVNKDNFESYLHNYAALYEGFFAERRSRYSISDADSLLIQLHQEFENKLNKLILHDRIKVPLYFKLTDLPEQIFKIDFKNKKVEIVSSISDVDYYSVSTSSWQIARVLDKRLSWEDFSLTFRLKLNREPDIYQTLIQGFLIMEAKDMNWFCNKLLSIESKGERIIVESQGTKYSIDRYCPHQGADLAEGWMDDNGHLVCPRHRWCFDLQKEGSSLTSNDSIHSICLEND